MIGSLPAFIDAVSMLCSSAAVSAMRALQCAALVSDASDHMVVVLLIRAHAP
jgi:hypothetical protein